MFSLNMTRVDLIYIDTGRVRLKNCFLAVFPIFLMSRIGSFWGGEESIEEHFLRGEFEGFSKGLSVNHLETF